MNKLYMLLVTAEIMGLTYGMCLTGYSPLRSMILAGAGCLFVASIACLIPEFLKYIDGPCVGCVSRDKTIETLSESLRNSNQ